MKKISVLFLSVFFAIVLPFCGIRLPAASAASNKNYFTVYEGKTKDKVLFLKGEDVNVGDKYLSNNNNLYEIIEVDENAKIAYTKFLQKENLPSFDIKPKRTESVDSVLSTNKKLAAKNVSGSALVNNKQNAVAATNKKVGLYHTHNDECYFTPDGIDSIYGKGGIHDVGKSIKNNLEKIGVNVTYREDLHLPHNSGAYTRSQVTAVALLNFGVDAIFDIHRDSTKRSEYLTTVNGEKMSSVRMVVGSGNANYEENKNFAYTIKAYADKVYPGFIKDIYIGKGNYNQQLTPRAMLFEMGCENIEKDLVLKSTNVLAKVIDVVLYGTNNASDAALADVDLVSSTGGVTSINGLVGSNSNKSVNSNQTLWVVLGVISALVVTFAIVMICSKKARYKVGRFFSELFAGIFGKRKA